MEKYTSYLTNNAMCQRDKEVNGNRKNPSLSRYATET